VPNVFIKLTLVIGCIFCLNAGWLPAKAWLSQQLISYSWDKSLSHNNGVLPSNIKPWPWADTYPIAKLTFQRLNKEIVVLNGGDPTTLAFSAGAIAPFNQLNTSKAFVVAGHRDSHFSFLKDIIMHDVISLSDKNGHSQLYQVEAIDIVDASKGDLPVSAEDPSLVLITCYPFDGAGSDSNERYVITARLL